MFSKVFNSKTFKSLFRHKLISLISFLMIIIGGYFAYQGLAEDGEIVHYVTAAVEKGTIIVSVSGNGQVSASNQVDIKPKVSGEVVYLDAESGQEVKADTLLAQIDSRSAQKAVRDAETSLETAQLELEKLLQPADNYSLMQAENSLIQAQDSLTKLKFTQETNYRNALETKEKSKDNLAESYEDAFNTVADSFLDLPSLMTGLDNILYGYELGDQYTWNKTVLANSIYDSDNRYQLEKFINSAEASYKTAKTAYDENLKNYKNTSRYSDREVIELLLNETLETTKAIAEAVKDTTNVLDYWVDCYSGRDQSIKNQTAEYQSELKTYTSKANSHISGLLSNQRSIKDCQTTELDAERNLIEIEQNQPLDLAAAERSVEEKEKSLAELKVGPDEFDIRAKKITIQQKEDALLDAQQTLADHYIRAPFNGLIAEVGVKKGESVSSASTVVILITKQQLAEITLNEVDIAQVKVGQKANITFDGIDDLTITGQVVKVDTIGAVSQGVVTYDAKITFDTQDERVRPGMSISVSIITEAKQNVLVVPNAAIKYQGDVC